MKAMLLAAGRGKRLGELTRNVPKPLLKIGDKSLIEYHLLALAKAGIHDVVINVAYLADQIIKVLSDGKRYGVNIHYSYEDCEDGLETGGGIYQALPLLGDKPFVVINSDIWTDYPYKTLPQQLDGLAHLILVENPREHQGGDFGLQQDRVQLNTAPCYTFSGIAVYHPQFFRNCKAGRYSVIPLLKEAIAAGKVTGEYYSGQWQDVGIPDRYFTLAHSAIVA